MIYRYLTSYAMENSKLQASLNSIHSELKLEKMSSLYNNTRIKGIEDLVLKLELDPRDIKAT